MRTCKICGGQVRIIPKGKIYIDTYNKLIIYGVGFGQICMLCALKFKQNINNFQDDIKKSVDDKLKELKKQLGITNKQADKIIRDTLPKKRKMQLVKKLAEKMQITPTEYEEAINKLK